MPLRWMWFLMWCLVRLLVDLVLLAWYTFQERSERACIRIFVGADRMYSEPVACILREGFWLWGCYDQLNSMLREASAPKHHVQSPVRLAGLFYEG